MAHILGSANMAPILFAKETYSNPYNTKRGYGPGVIEAADDRLDEEVKARRQANGGSSPTCGPEARAKLEFELSKATLDKARRNRKTLEAELEEAKALEALWEHKTELTGKHLKKIRESKKEKAEKERRRQAASKKKERRVGAMPTGVEKNKKPAPKKKFSGFRLTKQNGEWMGLCEGVRRRCRGAEPKERGLQKSERLGTTDTGLHGFEDG